MNGNVTTLMLRCGNAARWCRTNGNGNENAPAKSAPMHANSIRALLSQNYVRRMRLHVQHKIRKRNYANKYAIHAKCGEIVTFYKSNQELYCQ